MAHAQSLCSATFKKLTNYTSLPRCEVKIVLGSAMSPPHTARKVCGFKQTIDMKDCLVPVPPGCEGNIEIFGQARAEDSSGPELG